jgi:hypothetical protein
MSDTSNVQSVESTTPAADPSVVAADGKKGPSGAVSGSTIINNLADLKEKAPEMYQKMLEGIAQTICRQIKRQDDRLRQKMREGRTT